MCASTSTIVDDLNELFLLEEDDDDRCLEESDDERDDYHDCNIDLQAIVQRSWCDVMLIWVVLPVLLIVQFVAPFMVPTPGALILTQTLDYHMVLCALGLFLVTMFLFEQSTHDSVTVVSLLHADASGNREKERLSSLFLILSLLPEVIMDWALILLFFDRLLTAFIFLQICVLLMSIFVVCSSVFILITCRDVRMEEKNGDESTPYLLLLNEDKTNGLCAVQTV
jgi:hypothetical protein